MSNFVVWIDQEHAKIFDISKQPAMVNTLEAKLGHLHTHRHDNLDAQKSERGLFMELGKSLFAAEKILILGPGMAKHHFYNHLSEHWPQLLKKVVGCETVDHPSEQQIAAIGRKAFLVA